MLSPLKGVDLWERVLGTQGRKKEEDYQGSIWISKDNGMRLSRGNSGEGAEKPKVSEKAGRYSMEGRAQGRAQGPGNTA